MTNKQLTIAQLVLTIIMAFMGWQGYNIQAQLQAMQSSHAQAKAELIDSVKSFVTSKINQKLDQK